MAPACSGVWRAQGEDSSVASPSMLAMAVSASQAAASGRPSKSVTSSIPQPLKVSPTSSSNFCQEVLVVLLMRRRRGARAGRRGGVHAL